MIVFEAELIATKDIITSTCVIQKIVCGKLNVLLSIDGRWHYVKPETLKIKAKTYLIK